MFNLPERSVARLENNYGRPTLSWQYHGTNIKRMEGIPTH